MPKEIVFRVQSFHIENNGQITSFVTRGSTKKKHGSTTSNQPNGTLSTTLEESEKQCTTSFITLPHELRQRILLNACSIEDPRHERHKQIGLDFFDKDDRGSIDRSRRHFLMTMDTLESTAKNLLSTHEEIQDDVRFAVNRWIRDLRVLLSEEVREAKLLSRKQKKLVELVRSEVLEMRIREWVVTVKHVGGIWYWQRFER